MTLMRVRRWRIFLVAAVLLAFLAPAAVQVASAPPAAAATKVYAPSGVKVTFHKNYAKVTWNKAKGAKGYVVHVTKDGYYGPFAGYTTTGTSKSISYSKFPYRTSKGAYRITVRAKNGSASSSVITKQKVRVVGDAVSIKNKTKAKAKTQSCLKAGLAAATTTMAGAVTVTAASYVIPGVNAVTFGGSLIASGSAGAGTYIVCVATAR